MREMVFGGNVYDSEYLAQYEIYQGKHTFKSTSERNEVAKQLRKEGWKVKSFTYSDFCGFDAQRERIS
jgi:hypothetical protein